MQSFAKHHPKGNKNYGGACQRSNRCRDDPWQTICETAQVKHGGVSNERGKGYDD